MAKYKVFRKGVVIGIIFLFFGASIVSSISININNSNSGKIRNLTITNEADFCVNDDYNESTPEFGKKNFSSINDAVFWAPAGSIIEVCNGTYNETVFVHKQLTLKGKEEDYHWGGDDENGTIINGTNKAFCFIVAGATGTIIQDFIILKSNVSGIFILNSKNVQIIRNRIQPESRRGIFGVQAKFCIITECNISGSEIPRENITVNRQQGIYLSCSDRCVITKNHVENLWSGIEIIDCEYCDIISNHIENISHFDIWLEYTAGTEVKKSNFCDNNYIGIIEGDNPLNARFRQQKRDIVTGDEWDENFWTDWLGLPNKWIIGRLGTRANELSPITWTKDIDPQPTAWPIPYYC